MDPSRFDALTVLLGRGASRRGAIAAAVGLVASLTPGRAGTAKNHRQRHGDRKGKRGDMDRRAAAEAGCYGNSRCKVGPGRNLSRCNLGNSSALEKADCRGCNLSGANLSNVNARGANLAGANLGRACLVGADLTGASLKGANLGAAVFCDTTMPDGSINNSSCATPIGCCPTCNVPLGGNCAGAGALCCRSICQNGVCVCPAGETPCSGDCKNLNTDRSNCGACGAVCPPETSDACAAGECRCGSGPSCVSGRVCRDGICDCPEKPVSCTGACASSRAASSRGSEACSALCPPHTFLFTWGQRGDDEGEFESPLGVAVAPNGTVFATDTGNSRVQVFSATGAFLRQWGSRGAGGGDQLREPNGIAVSPDGSRVYVTDSSEQTVHVFSPNGDSLREWRLPFRRDYHVRYPQGVALSPDGSWVYVVDTNNHVIAVFTSEGEFESEWGGHGTADGKFDFPRYVAVDAEGQVYVTDAANNRVQVFHANGTYLRQWGSFGKGNGQFNLPSGIAVGGETVYVADPRNRRVQAFDRRGAYLCQWGSQGRGEGQFSSPNGVAVGVSGTIYVTDAQNDRIQAFGTAP